MKNIGIKLVVEGFYLIWLIMFRVIGVNSRKMGDLDY